MRHRAKFRSPVQTPIGRLRQGLRWPGPARACATILGRDHAPDDADDDDGVHEYVDVRYDHGMTCRLRGKPHVSATANCARTSAAVSQCDVTATTVMAGAVIARH